VQERLLEYEERKRLKHIQAVQKQNREARELANGVSNAAATSAAANNRLYHQAQKKKLEYDERLERQATSHYQENSFQPTINKTSKKLAQKNRPQHVPVEDSLAFRGQLTHHKNQMRQQKNDLLVKMRANESKINPTSERILREKYEDSSGGAAARLTKPIGAVKQKTREGIEEPTFQPQLHHKPPSSSSHSGHQSTPTGSGGGGGEGDMYNRSQKWLQQKQTRLERERRAKESSELKQCSFKPQIVDRNQQSLNGSYDLGGSGAEYEGRGGLTIAERQADWATKRYILSFIHSFIHAFMHSCIHAFMHSLV
jgi:hypothetical protein